MINQKSNIIIPMEKNLILLNDDTNTFKYVYASLIRDLDMNPYQAESCCTIAHGVGRCSIKNGDLLELLPLQEKLGERNIKTRIE